MGDSRGGRAVTAVPYIWRVCVGLAIRIAHITLAASHSYLPVIVSGTKSVSSKRDNQQESRGKKKKDARCRLFSFILQISPEFLF